MKENIAKSNQRNRHVGVALLIGFTVLFLYGNVPGWAEGEMYKENFDGEINWKASIAEVSPYGRVGKALRISTWVKDGEKAQWNSPLIKVAPGSITCSAWMAQNLAFVQDNGFGGILAAVLYDGSNQEIEKIELMKITRPLRKDNGDAVVLPEKGGLDWRYFEEVINVPEKASGLMLVFTWTHFTSWRPTKININGEVYLDDVMITNEASAREEIPEIGGRTKESYPYCLRINTPVEANLFLADDPLEFTVRLDGTNGPPTIEDGMKLEYRIVDYQRLLIDKGSVPLIQPYYYRGDMTDKAKMSLLKPLYLSSKVREQVGRWMAIEVKLVNKENKVSASGENAFAITNPRRLTVNEARRSKFYGSGRIKIPEDPKAPWGISEDLNFNERLGMFGEESLGHEGSMGAWKECQPTKDSPISFAHCYPGKDYSVHQASQQTFAFEEREPLMDHWLLYNWPPAKRTVPDWAWLDGEKKDWKDHDISKLDLEAYKKYIVEYVKHTRTMTYCITLLEGETGLVTPDIVKATYEAVKSVDPRLKTVAHYCLLAGASHAKEIIDAGMADYMDVVVDDIYFGRIERGAREFKEYLAKAGKPKELWIQEYCYVGSRDQDEIARRMTDYVLWAFANGVDKLRWYWHNSVMKSIRSPIPVEWSISSMIEGQGEKLSVGLNNIPPVSISDRYNVTGNITPMLQAITYYQLGQHFALKDFRSFVDFGPKVEGVLMDGEGRSAAGVWTLSGTPPRIVVMDSGDIPYCLTDMYGRREIITPLNGKSLMTLSDDPLLFDFQGKVPHLKATEGGMKIKMTPGKITVGGKGRLEVMVENPFGQQMDAVLKVAIDETWQVEPSYREVKLNAGKKADVFFDIIAPTDLHHGKYPAFIKLEANGKVIGWVEYLITVGGPVEINLESMPYTSNNFTPGIRVKIKNHTAGVLEGKIYLQGDIGTDMRPGTLSRQVSVPALKEAEEVISITGWVPYNSHDYTINAWFKNNSGKVLATSTRDLGFRGVTKRRETIVVDGNLNDWDMKNLLAYDFYRPYAHMDHVKFTPELPYYKGLDVKFYTQWDEEYLYFAFIIIDPDVVGKGKGVEVWPYDCLIFCFYPWEVGEDKIIKGAHYKDHIALGDGDIGVFDRCQGPIGGWTIGSGEPEGVKKAIKRTNKGMIMEFAIPKRHLQPLSLEPGAEFRLGLRYVDADSKGERSTVLNSMMCGLAWFYAISNTDANPLYFGSFELME